MARSIFWTRPEEAQLVELGRTPRAIEMKLTRLGVVEVGRKISSTTTAVTSRKLLTHEETLKILAG